MASKRWILPEPPPAGCQELAARLRVAPFTAQLLLARGMADEDDCRRFLDPKLDHLHDPFLLPDARRAVERLARAVRDGEKILVHGDYDVDGVCSAALLTRVLKVLKANVEPFVPHRQDGYDLNVETVRRAAAEGVRLILTADCGIVAFDSAEAAWELGVDLVVTDHHEPSPDGRLPRAVAVVNPHRADSEYPFASLCGTGVAYKLCGALLQHLGVSTTQFSTAYLDLVALATCADCMPLVDENRVFVKHGLETLRATKKAGLKALMEVAKVTPQGLNARSLGFTLGPRINAIGRMDAAAYALNLLLTVDAAEAKELAERLDEANTNRQKEQEHTFQEATRQVERFIDDRILVLASPKWSAGIVGIVASKIAEAHCRPAILIAIHEQSGRARGSCRSIEGFHIFEAVNTCREHLVRCGGHQAAAGFEILPDNVDRFRAAIQQYAASALDDALLQPTVFVDAVLPPDALDMRLAQELTRLEPFGHGNHEPVFMARGLNVREQRRLANRSAQGPDHLKLRVEAPGAPRGQADAVFWRSWGRAQECEPQGSVDACFTLEINIHNGYRNLQLNLRDLRPCE